MTARSILVAGTASHVGKSTVATGLCRLLSDRGVDVAPFKAQNMSNNARVVPRTTIAEAVSGDVADNGADPASLTSIFGEIGVSQYVQAQAARIRPTTDHNPVLLKPRGDGESQLVLDGEAVGHFAAGQYYETHWDDALATAKVAYDRLAADHDVIVMEGAGSIAELNLHHRDLSNVELPRHAEADIVLVADIERGGVFASLVGTLDLMPADLRENVFGAIITKFRGDVSLLDPGLDAFEERTGIPVLGVLPYDDPGLPEEDSVALPASDDSQKLGDDDGVPENRAVTIAVPRFPRISNATDMEPLARIPGVRVRYQPLAASLEDVDAVVLSGTKNTVDDLQAAREAGFHHRIRAFDGPIVGLCGGYQMLGERVIDAGLEGTRTDGTANGRGAGATRAAGGLGGAGGRDSDSSDQPRTVIDGFGLLPVETRFRPEKTVIAVERDLRPVPALGNATGRVSGYEIHAGETRHLEPLTTPFLGSDDAVDRNVDSTGDPTGASAGAVLGTYLHGLFENEHARDGFVDAVFTAAGLTRPDSASEPASPYAGAASLLETHLDDRVMTDLLPVETRKP